MDSYMCVMQNKKISMVKSILIVDDCPLDQQLVGDLFKRSMCVNGWSITIAFASCLEEAKIYLRNQQFDIITLDGQMGLELGYNLIPFIEKSQTQNPRIIMISNHDKSITIGLDRGAHHSIIKKTITKEVRINTEFILIPVT
jgi:DNA-binding response OmpR family regulator